MVEPSHETAGVSRMQHSNQPAGTGRAPDNPVANFDEPLDEQSDPTLARPTIVWSQIYADMDMDLTAFRPQPGRGRRSLFSTAGIIAAVLMCVYPML